MVNTYLINHTSLHLHINTIHNIKQYNTQYINILYYVKMLS